MPPSSAKVWKDRTKPRNFIECENPWTALTVDTSLSPYILTYPGVLTGTSFSERSKENIWCSWHWRPIWGVCEKEGLAWGDGQVVYMLRVYTHFALFYYWLTKSSSPQLDASLNPVTEEFHHVMDQSITPTVHDVDLLSSWVLTYFCGVAQGFRDTWPFLSPHPLWAWKW